MKHLLIVLFLIIIVFPVSSQMNRKLWGGIEYGYGIGLSDSRRNKMKTLYNINDQNAMTMNSFRFVMGYYLNPRFSLGAGLAVNSHSNPQLNTLPLFAEVRYHPFSNLMGFFVNADIGYSLYNDGSTYDSNVGFDPYELKKTSGGFCEISAGWKLLKVKNITIAPAIGYNMAVYKTIGKVVDEHFLDNERSNWLRHSIFLRLGVWWL